MNKDCGRSSLGLCWTRALLVSAMVLFAFHGSTHMVPAGDTWIALALGRHVSDHGVGTTDPLSFNSLPAGPSEDNLAKYPSWMRGPIRTLFPTGWINQNWLSHVFFYKMVSWFGEAENPNYNALVVFKVLLCLLVVASVYGLGRAAGLCPTLATIAACSSMLVSRPFLDIRPAGFTNLFVPLYATVLILAVRGRHRWLWFLVPITALWSQLHGGFVYALMMFAPFLGVNLLLHTSRRIRLAISFTCFLLSALLLVSKLRVQDALLLCFFMAICLIAMNWMSDACIRPPRRLLVSAAVAGITTLAGIVILSPFHFTNLTHWFEVSLDENADSWRQIGEWMPAFDWQLGAGFQGPIIGDTRAFAALSALMVAALVSWVLSFFLVSGRSAPRVCRGSDRSATETWTKGLVDLSFVVIAVATVCMAVLSRRFIPLAASVACPLVLLVMLQTWQWWRSRTAILGNSNRVPVPDAISAQVSKRARLVANICLTLVLATLTAFWGSKLRSVYFEAWPRSFNHSSVFSRMSVGHEVPHKAVHFFRANAVQGRMLNYWNDGGVIAWGQKPDEATGGLPLRTFIDGRAQAAFSHSTFSEYLGVYFGIGSDAPEIGDGESGANLEARTASWISQKLRSHRIWIVLLPKSGGDQEALITKYLPLSDNWKTVYFDDVRRILVDADSQEGHRLITNVVEGEALFPDEYTKNLSTFNAIWENLHYVRYGELYAMVRKAIDIHPSQTAVLAMVELRAFDSFRSAIDTDLERLVRDFGENKEHYRREHGYLERLKGVIAACQGLATTGSEQQGFLGLAQKLGAEAEEIKKRAAW